MKVRVAVPCRFTEPGGHREQLWRLVYRRSWAEAARWPGWEVVIGDAPGEPYNRSASINAAAAHDDGEWDLLVLADADTVAPLGQVVHGVRLAQATGAAVLPFTDYAQLRRDVTLHLLDPEAAPPRSTLRRVILGHVSGCLVVPRPLWEMTGGFDERFRGWGGEDRAFAFACQTLAGLRRLPGEVVHLWHERSPERDADRPEYRRNLDLALRYKAAAGGGPKQGILPAVPETEPDVDALLSILQEPGGPLAAGTLLGRG